LFSNQPSILADGTLRYTPAADANGSAIVTVALSDDGGTNDGGVDTSGPQTFTIDVTAVNDTPSFTKGPNQTVLAGAGAQSVSPWTTALSSGPSNEFDQVLSFTVTNNPNPGLFSVPPSIAADGRLTYTPGTSAGSATITVTLSDNGGGTDTSAPQSFTITVDPEVTGPVVVFADSFEDGLGNWTQDQNDWFRRNRRATDGSYSAEVDGRAVDAQLVSPIIPITDDDATVTFSWFIERSLDRGEYIAFDVSVNGGQTWTQRAILRGNVDQEKKTHNVEIPVNITGATDLRLRFRATISRRSEDANLDNVVVTTE
jgi:hypothetical protein